MLHRKFINKIAHFKTQNKLDLKCAALSFVTFFCANFYNNITDKKNKRIYDIEMSFAAYIIMLSFGSAYKSGILTIIYPLVWFDICYSYYNNQFYKNT